MCIFVHFKRGAFSCLKEGWVLYGLLLDELGLVGGEEGFLDALQGLVETFNVIWLLAFSLLEMVIQFSIGNK